MTSQIFHTSTSAYHIGDLVEVLPKQESYKYYGDQWRSPEMDKFVGTIARITKLDAHHGKVQLEGCSDRFGIKWNYPIEGLRLRAHAIVDTQKTRKQTKRGGLKYDDGKLLFGCLTRGLADQLRVLAAVLTYGARKYKEDSWQTVPDAKRRYLDAADRHFNDYRRGIAFDRESGLHHLAHVAINVLFALYFEMNEDVKQHDFTAFNDPKGLTK